MIDVKKAQMLFGCCCVCLTVATASRADFVGVVSEFKIDGDTADQCGKGLTVCNVSIQFDDDDDRLLSVAFSDVQVLGAPGALFNHHVFGQDVPYACALLVPFPDLICDSYVAIGEKCAGISGTTPDGDFDSGEFNSNGHIVGGWFNSNPYNGLGDAYNYPDGKVFILQSAVASGLSVEGSASVFWQKYGDPTVFENAVKIVCGVGCPDDYVCDDAANPCTADVGICIDQVCVADPIDCDDFNPCTDDDCNPDSGCVHTPNDNPCDDGDGCTADDACSGGECIGGTPIDCDDNDACTEDSCDSDAGGCVADPIDCDDDDACTEDSCDSDFGCMNTPLDCQDGNECTGDGCDPGTGCTYEEIECPEGQVCDPDTGQCVEASSGFLDIIPGKCPNRLQRNGLGFIKVSLVSAAVAQDLQAFNACEVDVSTIQLCRADGTWGCAEPTSNPAPRCRDRATPFLGELCGCHSHRKDGIDDLDMLFKVADVVNNLGLADMPAGVSVELELTALTNDGQTVIAGDCVELGRDLGPNP